MEKSPELAQLGKVLEASHESRRSVALRLRTLRDSVDEIVHCPVSVAESCSEGSYALLPREAH